MTACAREGCGHATEAHFGGSRCRVEGWGVNAGSTDFGRCSCPAYKPAPTPTADVRCTCPGGEQFHSRTNERCPRSMIASFREAWPDPDAAPSLGERDDFCVICGKQGTHTEWCARRDAAPEERARTAEPEVERLRAELAAAGLAVQADARATLAARAAHDAEHARALRAEEAEAVLRRQVDAVRALHIANRFGECQHCIVGEEYDGSLLYQPYPCDTISALDGA